MTNCLIGRKKWDLELVQAFARPLKRRILDRELIGKTFSIECPYLFGLLAALLRRLPVLGELCPLTYVDHVSKVVLEIFDELVQTGGLVKAPNKQSSFLCDNQRNRRWGEAEKWNNKRKPTLLQATLGYTVYTAMIKKKGNDSSRRRKTGVSEHKYTTRDNQIMIVAFQRAKG